MTTYQKFRKLDINFSAVGLEQRESFVPYFCTPKGAKILGWAGVDGIHYCTVRGLGETVFAVSPMNFGDYVHPIARSFEDLLRMLLYCADMAALEQCYAWDEEQFNAFLLDCPPTSEQKVVLDVIREKLGLEPMVDAFACVKALQAEFDLSRIPYTEDYYDTDMNAAAPVKPTEWKVTYGGGLWSNRGRGGREIPVNKVFRWSDELWHVPAVYACPEGLVIDFCVEIEPEKVTAFIDQWDLLHEDEHCYTREEQRQMELEHPLNVNFNAAVTVNDKSMRQDHGCGISWIAPSCLNGNSLNSPEAQTVMEHYGLDESHCWTIRRLTFPWATKNKPNIKSLKLHLEREMANIPGIRFKTPAVGESVSFTHPISGMEYTLTVHEYEVQEMGPEHFRDDNMEYPTHYAAMTYTLQPDISGLDHMMQDCAEGDSPRRKAPPPSGSPEACCSVAVVGIIGRADGPVALIRGTGTPKLHAACSSLHFEPVKDVEWQILFREKLIPDMDIALLP